jgi:N-acetylmuramoyl-L-alanine amidase
MLLVAALACTPAVVVTEPPRPSTRIVEGTPAVWPEPGALRTLAPYTPPGWRPRRLVLDPGHGAPPDNLGNTSVACRREADEMLRVALSIAPDLGSAFEVRLARPDEGLVGYRDRIAAADAWPAAALVSLHSDARKGSGYRDHPETGCPTSDGGRGFSVLWSDEGEASLVAARRRLARAIAGRLVEAGFQPFAGGYRGLYDLDPEHPGVYVDRHEPTQRIAMLRRPSVPSVIVETHQALDPDDVARWQQPSTVAAFGAALRRGVVDALSE